MSTIQIFSDPRFGELRTTGTPDNPLFCLTDVCRVSDLTNPSAVSQRLDDDQRPKLDLGRQGETLSVTESGLYEVIFRSDKPEAKVFRKWVTSEVLPSIRKTGACAVPSASSSPLSSPDIAAALRTMLDDYAAVKFDREKLRQDNARLTAEVKLLPSPAKRATDKLKDLTADDKRLEARVSEPEKDLVGQNGLLDKYGRFIKDHNLKHRVQGITASLDEWILRMKSLSDDTKKLSRRL